jgi:Tol biopolymer transport system component
MLPLGAAVARTGALRARVLPSREATVKASRIVATGAAASLVAAVGLAGALPARAAPASAPALTGTSVTINNGPGDASDPHVSGDWVSYTDDSTGSLVVHYYNLATGQDASIPNPGGNDSLSGVSGTNAVYTHEDATGTFTITTYAIGSGNPPVPIDPAPGTFRLNPAIGGNTVAWVDFTANPSTPQIIVYDTATQTTTTLAADNMANVQPAVSPDGKVVVWAKCDPSGSPCNIWEARQVSGTWTSTALTTGSNDNEQPHTDGNIVVYQSLRSGQQGIYWQPAGGGTEQQIPEPAGATYGQPHTSGGLISFEGALSGGTSEIYAYSIATQATYQITNTAGASNTLDDISVTPDGQARVVWEAQASPDQVDGFVFQVPQASQAISFTAPAAGIAGGSATLSATGGGSGNPVTFSVDPASGAAVCTVSGDTVSYTAAGSCVIDANQAGNLDYTAAPQVTQTITVDQAPAFVIDSPPLTAQAGQPYDYTFTASGTPAPSYALAPGAPSWLSINPGTGEVTGTPPAGTTSFTYSVTATNTAGTATAGPYTVTIAPATSKADVSAALACPGAMTAGRTGTCTLTVTNNGPAAASKLIAGIALPPALSEVSCTPGCAEHDNLLTWTQDTLPSGGTATFTTTIQANAAGKALVLAAAASRNPDPTPLNNIAIQKISINR